MSESLKTIEVTLPQASVGRLEKLQAKMEVDSIAVVLANALRLFEAVVEETEQGTKFFIQREGLEIEPFEIFEQETKI